MIAFEVTDMRCGRCAGTITRALTSADPGARVTVDLARHLVMVESGGRAAQDLQDAIAAAGYTPSPAAAPATALAAPGGGCCGHGA